MDAHAVLSPKMRAWVAARGEEGVASSSSAPAALRPCPVDHLRSLVKTPAQSLLTVILPFGSDAAMRRLYVNFRGQLRVGRLLEELDSFAGNVAYLHADDGDVATEPPLLVTASTDRVDLLHYPLPVDRDLALVGMVSYVGSSSINVDVDVMMRPTARDATATLLMQASLTFVARNRENKAVAMPQLAPSSPFELALYEAGARAQSERKAARSRSLSKLPPSQEELAAVHALFQRLPSLTRRSANGETAFIDAGRQLFMDDTSLDTVHITMPQDRNVHGKIFGGFIMRQAFETAWACAWRHTGQTVKFLALDDIAFHRPVDVGTLLTFRASLSFTAPKPSKTFSVSVVAMMEHPTPETHGAKVVGGGGGGSSESSVVTNTFHFTFYVDDPDAVPDVYPRTYEDAMAWIEASRRYRFGKLLAERRKSASVALRFPAPPPASDGEKVAGDAPGASSITSRR